MSWTTQVRVGAGKRGGGQWTAKRGGKGASGNVLKFAHFKNPKKAKGIRLKLIKPSAIRHGKVKR